MPSPTTPHGRKAILVLTVAAMAAAGLAFPQTALAGSSGQRIQFCSSAGKAGYATADGNDHNGKPAIGRYWRFGSNGCVTDTEGWWQGRVRINWLMDDASSRTTYCDVPKSQAGDVFTCRG
ncbi:hypothetical protein SGFS_066380 [Streptomyces graminofaciens]|jgi:hypothetical protein|uniref:Secreted protein n=1 Tax=Streptomyces graminofaciens TaxID=68212 RepID=A0ABN5VPH3_9ACTN|nr:hypothetical protein [Streptomyces graminofaciens]BBC35344.1 hypothetical protein SGFS_066380 [Streptomyces graminofaciens]